MDFALPGDDDESRLSVRAWLQNHPDPSGRQLAEAGLVAPQLPEPWGRGADPVAALVISDELDKAGIALPDNIVGIGWAAPALVAGGSPALQQRHLLPILSGEEIWCQLFSEPEAGSDLAAVRTRAVPAGDHYIVNGQKIWSSLAEHSQYGLLVARTDPSAAKHRGLSYFACPLHLPGITIRPIREMTGGYHFNEVFFDDVHIPTECLIGAENAGWDLIRLTLDNERLKLSGGRLCWGKGPSSAEFFDLIVEHGGVADPVLRDEVTQLYLENEILKLVGYRVLADAAVTGRPGPEASIKKVMGDEFGQRLLALAKTLTGTNGLYADTGPLGGPAGDWNWAYLFGRSLTIGGGTTEIQRNILGELVLGLPREPA